MKEHQKFAPMIREQLAYLGRPGQNTGLKLELLDDVGRVVALRVGAEPPWIQDLRALVEAGAL